MFGKVFNKFFVLVVQGFEVIWIMLFNSFIVVVSYIVVG